MEKVHCLKRFVFLVMALGLVTTFTSCDDDDEPKPNVPALTDVVGNYAGKCKLHLFLLLQKRVKNLRVRM